MNGSVTVSVSVVQALHAPKTKWPVHRPSCETLGAPVAHFDSIPSQFSRTLQRYSHSSSATTIMDQNQRIKYSPLSEDAKTSFSDNSIANSQRGLLSGNDNAAYDDDDRSRMRLQFRILITANGLLFILSIAALVASTILISRCTFDYGLNAALKKTSGYCECHLQLQSVRILTKPQHRFLTWWKFQ